MLIVEIRLFASAFDIETLGILEAFTNVPIKISSLSISKNITPKAPKFAALST